MGRTRIYVGRVGQRTRERDLEDLFRRYGRIRYTELKMGYAFIDFEDERDAEDAVKSLDGYDLDGSRLIVEWSRGPRSSSSNSTRAPNRAPQRSEYRAQVDNMPRDMSWQDLKDFFREAGEVVFADVYRDRSGSTKGIVEFRSRDDLRYAIRRLDGTDVRGSRLRVKEDRPRSRSRSRSPRRSPDRRSRRDSSPQRKRDRSSDRDRDRSPRKSSRDERKRRRTPSPAPASSNDTDKKRSPSPEADREQKESRTEHTPSPKRSPKRSRHSGSRSRSPSRSPEDTGKHNEAGDDKDEPRESNGREDDDRTKEEDEHSD